MQRRIQGTLGYTFYPANVFLNIKHFIIKIIQLWNSFVEALSNSKPDLPWCSPGDGVGHSEHDACMFCRVHEMPAV